MGRGEEGGKKVREGESLEYFHKYCIVERVT